MDRRMFQASDPDARLFNLPLPSSIIRRGGSLILGFRGLACNRTPRLAGKTPMSGDWSIFQRENLFRQKTLAEKHGIAPFARPDAGWHINYCRILRGAGCQPASKHEADMAGWQAAPRHLLICRGLTSAGNAGMCGSRLAMWVKTRLSCLFALINFVFLI